ncbi:hypothetical protein CC80DRAFT_560621 [Byssothecium circinans]|uniref:Uncharacterized protein n=1 Tax=Byssothecium circinans TaxID=147558 RepID=A0A6A5TZC4_9PLEO|nr:hypothetical protein CC80DRAFT_560621 [Byssothecium circinans]
MPRLFNITQAAILSTMNVLLDLTSPNTTTFAPSSKQQKFPSILSKAPLVQPIWTSPNLSSTFDNVAASMSNQFRNMSPHRHKGTLQQWTLYIHVEWGFLVFPGVLVLAGAAYVLLAIGESLGLGVPTWKEGALPMLLYGFGGGAQKALREERGGRGRWRGVEGNWVRFDAETDRLRIVVP